MHVRGQIWHAAELGGWLGQLLKVRRYLLGVVQHHGLMRGVGRSGKMS